MTVATLAHQLTEGGENLSRHNGTNLRQFDLIYSVVDGYRHGHPLATKKKQKKSKYQRRTRNNSEAFSTRCLWRIRKRSEHLFLLCLERRFVLRRQSRSTRRREVQGSQETKHSVQAKFAGIQEFDLERVAKGGRTTVMPMPIATRLQSNEEEQEEEAKEEEEEEDSL